ncbi:MAG: Hsp70 family protein, partial [Myxococcales bacterium]|nr:Hsp70 family protein [Myxococcales bacterium]
FLTADASGPKHMNIKLSRAKFEQLCEDLFERALDPCRQALKDAGKRPSDINEVILVGGSTRIPKVQELVKSFFGREPHRGVNPDEVVGLGAAVQAGVLAGEVQDILLLDVTPLSLGIETLGGVLTRLIERNTTIPTRKTEVFSTASDSQTSVEVHVLQGEREMARDNRTLGRLSLAGIPPAPRGVPQIEVTFDIDANGILKVSAKDKATNKEQKITITASSGLSEAEIKQMVDDAKQHETDDRERREAIEERNQLDSLVYQTEKSLKEFRDKVPASEVQKLDDALAAAKKALDGTDTAAIKEARDNLTQASHKLAELMYKQATDAGEGPTGPGPEKPEEKKKKDDDVIDADFEEV